MNARSIEPFSRPFDVTMSPPGSKSLTNRALILAALGDGQSELSNVLFADDTLVMLENLARLGFQTDVDRAKNTVRVGGRGGEIQAASAELFCGNSGTTIRFLTALCSLGRGAFSLDGIPRMRQRPIGPLVELLKNLGGRARYDMSEGFPPVTVLADRLPGGRCRFGTSTSSQFLSAVLQVAPYTRHETRVDLDTPQTSWPYVAMTMRLMDEFGHTPELVRDPLTGDPKQIIITQGAYRATNYAIEPDASNASYFLAAAAIHSGSKITIKGLGKHSLQGDVGFADVLRRMGASVAISNDAITLSGPDQLEAIDADLSAMPDTAQTLAVAALFAEGETTLRGLHTLRVKETDRIAALATELQKLGAGVKVEGDDLTITPPPRLQPASIATYDDHRMAMSFALAGTKSPGVVIEDPACVNKTYPEYFADLELLRKERG
ncbi:MAG TPA: 3-phosphoshikimate 1-carboxyvinyltransferase [Tepidisphaeraceae bacterium]|jgi:3-phosphoshikimate 1-carboxyvinyltransferase|nr:3-phosphoshikimate 1-carboxyvinyltransferase [Tepidisphaeraceae bacterium]